MFAGLILIQGGLWELLSHASTFAWIVMGILIIMSLISWGVIINKWRLFRVVETDSRRFLAAFRRRGELHDVHDKCLSFRRTPLCKVLAAGLKEYEAIVRIKNGEEQPDSPLQLSTEELETVDMILEKESNIEIGRLERNVAFLATTGNIAPFFGLLGTCWGIMYAFLNIGIQGSASLIVVAPGIAEALVATVLGLAVAIPAVIGFNWCNTKLKFMTDDLNNFSLEFMAALNREQIR